MKKFNVAVVGATGMVGRTFISILQERNFPIDELKLLASKRSIGQKLKFRDQEIAVEELTSNSFNGVDIALFSAGAGISCKFAPIAADSGTTVIDNSSAFRMDENIPLIVPEVNPHALKPDHKIIANPNCSTIQMVVAAKPLHDKAKIKRLVISTYQSVSGKGKDAVDEMMRQTKAFLNSEKITPKEFPHQIAFNMLPQIDVFDENGDTKEEIKMINETRKIMCEPDLAITATCVRVPVSSSHCVSLNAEFENPITPENARAVLSDFPGIIVMDNPAENVYPTPAFGGGKDEVFVGRIRKDLSVKNGLNLWIVSDNLRKGAALNTIQIAELLK